MKSLLAPFANPIYAAMRIVVGFLFLCHGLQKVFGMLGGEARPLASLIGVGGVIELVGGALIAVGLGTRYAAFLCSGQMAVAYFMFHQSNGVLPIQNNGELAAIYSFVFLFIAAHGPGMLSLDRILGRDR